MNLIERSETKISACEFECIVFEKGCLHALQIVLHVQGNWMNKINTKLNARFYENFAPLMEMNDPLEDSRCVIALAVHLNESEWRLDLPSRLTCMNFNDPNVQIKWFTKLSGKTYIKHNVKLHITCSVH